MVGPVPAWGGDGLAELQSMRVGDIGRTLVDWKLVVLGLLSAVVVALLWGGDAIRPGSLSRAGVRDVKPLPAAMWLFGAFVVLLSAPLAHEAARAQGWVVGPDAGSLRRTLAPMSLAWLAGLVTSLGMLYMAARAAPGSGLKPAWIDGVIGVGLFLLAAPLVLLAGEAALLLHESIRGEPEPAIAHPALTMLVNHRGEAWSWAIILGAVIGAPILEETVYRVFLQSAVLRATGRAWVAIAVSAIVFGAMHAVGPQGVKWYAALQVGVLGLCCGLAFERTKRVVTPMAMHAAFNAVNIVLALWSGAET